MARSFKYYFGVTLADGTEHRFETNTPKSHWKSWVVQQMPYGTVFTGCKFTAGLVDKVEVKS